MNDLTASLGVGVEVVFGVSREVGTVADVEEPRENGPQPEMVFRVNDEAGDNVGWFTAAELRRHRPQIEKVSSAR